MRILYLILFLSSFALYAHAQQPAPTLKPPSLQSFWGATKGGTFPLELALNIIDSSVRVIDDKKLKYPIASFIILYRSKDRYEDEQTGEIKTRFNNNSVVIRNAAVLEEKWRKMIYENLKPGDELFITDIIVRDKRGNFFKAPEIKVTVASE